MDINDFRGIVTALLLIGYLGLCFWAYSGKRKAAFEEAANLPFADDIPSDASASEPVSTVVEAKDNV